MKVTRCAPADLDDLAAFRADLWPEGSVAAHRIEAEAALASLDAAAFICRSSTGLALGFAEASVRREPVNGCDTSPVAFLEGIYVRPDHRRSGVGEMLMAAVEAWGRERGCVELGSDAHVENVGGYAFHTAVGFEARERVVCFRKRL